VHALSVSRNARVFGIEQRQQASTIRRAHGVGQDLVERHCDRLATERAQRWADFATGLLLVGLALYLVWIA